MGIFQKPGNPAYKPHIFQVSYETEKLFYSISISDKLSLIIFLKKSYNKSMMRSFMILYSLWVYIPSVMSYLMSLESFTTL